MYAVVVFLPLWPHQLVILLTVKEGHAYLSPPISVLMIKRQGKQVRKRGERRMRKGERRDVVMW